MAVALSAGQLWQAARHVLPLTPHDRVHAERLLSSVSAGPLADLLRGMLAQGVKGEQEGLVLHYGD